MHVTKFCIIMYNFTNEDSGLRCYGYTKHTINLSSILKPIE